MASKLNRIGKDIMSAMQNATERGTSSYDTTAEVRRIEGDTAWVHIAGGVDETPVKLTVSAKAGDSVQVRVGGGRAWITGNASAPPTDDRQANIATEKAETAGKEIVIVREIANTAKTIADTAKKIAGDTNQYFWHTESGTDTGAHITEKPQEEFLDDPANGGGNLLARSNGIAVRDGLTELATFGANSVRIGDEQKAHAIVNADGQTIYASNGTTQIAHLGYGDGKDEQGGTSIAPYYSLGERKSNSVVGNLSMSEGLDTTASGYISHAEGKLTVASGSMSHAEGDYTTASGSNSHAEGFYTTASGDASHASGDHTIAAGSCQTVVGKYNNNSQNNLFEVGNGTGTASRSNAFSVSKNGDLVAKGDLTINGNKTVITFDSGVASNGKWRYRKWSDGRYEAWYNSGSTTITATTSSGNGWYRNADAYTINTPSAGFLTVHYATVQVMAGYANIITSLTAANNSYIKYYVSHLGSLSSVTAYVTAYITGSW